ncbi:MAG: hypothetical protein IJ435_00115 [Clostridia bacterium]|nr:hypothetical protein [Clostridia bacterium]
MSKKLNILLAAIIVILAVVAVFAVANMDRQHDVIENISEVKLRAEALYTEGDINSAIYQMEVYCAYVSTDVEARAKLGDWYMETGDETKAYECYYNAALNKEFAPGKIKPLGVKNTSEIILEPIDEVVMEITADVRKTKDMRLIITGHNLVPEKVFEGRINKTNHELIDEDDYRTTDWFSVDPEGEYLTMSGGFNHAIWQFKNADGEITHYAVSTNSYREKDTYGVDVYQMARAAIPEKSSWCRVTYYDKSIEDATASIDEELTIVYGRLPGESFGANYAVYEIPDLKEGESIIYTGGKWNYIKDGKAEILEEWSVPDIERGSHITVSGTLPGKVSFENSKFADYSKDGIYTIRFDKNNPSAMGERLDNAKNLGFNAAVAQGTIALGENHFDSIYPWKDMKLCNIKGGTVTAYEGDESFSTDGTGGDVFVEIPKFYVKRVADENNETISISGVCHEGFEVEEAFVNSNGEETDFIYVAAYLTSVDENGNAVSRSGDNPVLELTPEELSESAGDKGYAEMDYAALGALQRLFMVETGLRNSQYLYMGACGYTMASDDGGNAGFAVALQDNHKTNCIVVSKAYYFEAGNSIILFNADNYQGTADEAYKNSRIVKTVIDNDDGTQSVFIEGDPIEVIKGKTAIAHTALKNGSTKSVVGHTGAVSTARGTVAFKYRNIENFWGNAFVYIDKVRIKDGEAVVERRSGEKVTVGYSIPNSSGLDTVDCMIRSMGYDGSLPQLMLPDAVGDGATISTYYGDTFIAGDDSEAEYVLHYGGGWSSQACAGLFNFVASSKADETHTNTSGRMMLVK